MHKKLWNRDFILLLQGNAVSTIGDVVPLYLVFAAGSAISLLPMLYMCFHRSTKEFILTH